VAGCGLASALLGLASTTRWANASARRTAAELEEQATGELAAVEPAPA
jgi:hypothetical protein